MWSKTKKITSLKYTTLGIILCLKTKTFGTSWEHLQTRRHLKEQDEILTYLGLIEKRNRKPFFLPLFTPILRQWFRFKKTKR